MKRAGREEFSTDISVILVVNLFDDFKAQAVLAMFGPRPFQAGVGAVAVLEGFWLSFLFICSVTHFFY